MQSEKLKVLYPDPSGELMNKFLFSLGKEMCNVGVDFILCVPQTNRMKGYTKSYVKLYEDYSILKSPVKKVLSYRRSWRNIYRYCIEEKVDIIHVSWFIFSPCDYYYLKKLRNKGIRIVITIHDVLSFNAKFYDKILFRRIYHMAEQIIYQSKAYQKELNEIYGLSDQVLNYVPHGNFLEYAEEVPKEEAFQELGLPEGKNVILFFGQIKKVKGLATLIRAFAKLSQENEDAILLIAGKVWKDSFKPYEKLIQQLGVDEKVIRHIRYIPDEMIKYYMSAADVVALPYKRIYQSGVLQLAIAYRKPVVASRIPGFVEYVLEGETGLLFEPSNSIDLVKCLQKLINNIEVTDVLVRTAEQRAEKEYSWKRIAELIVQLYRSGYLQKV